MTLARTPVISVVIPAYNRRDSVLTLLGDIYRQEDVTYEVIVVDDRSPDDTVAAIKAHFPNTKVLCNAVNGGPSVSRNRGVREAVGEYIVGIDSDVTLPDPKLFKRIADTFAAYPNATALALRVLEKDGRTDDGPRWCHPFAIQPYADQWVWSDYISGTGYACRREPMLTAGLFPEILYMHHEEVEISYRLLDDGGSILHCPDLGVLHHPHPVADRNRIEIYFHPRNQILLAVGLYSWPRAVVFLVPRTTFQFFRALFNGHLGSYVSAVRDAWKILPRRLKERRPLQSSTFRRISQLRRSANVATAPAWAQPSR